MADLLFIFRLSLAIAQIWAGVWTLAFSIALLRNCLFDSNRFVGPFELVGLLWRGEIRRASLSDTEGGR